MTADFLLGILTLPVVAGVGYGLFLLVALVIQSWETWRPKFVGDEARRARLAAAMAVANKLLVIRLPGGYVIGYRARVGDTFYGDASPREIARHVETTLLDLAENTRRSR